MLTNVTLVLDGVKFEKNDDFRKSGNFKVDMACPDMDLVHYDTTKAFLHIFTHFSLLQSFYFLKFQQEGFYGTVAERWQR